MKLGDDGISTVSVHDFYESLDASGLVDVVADVFVLAEIHSAVGHTMTFFQNPHLFGREGAVGDATFGLVACFRKVGHELLGIDRNLLTGRSSPLAGWSG